MKGVLKSRRIACLALLSIMSCIPGRAVAMHGGPQPAEVLGWDPMDKKVFVLIHHQDESDSAPTLLYLAVDGPLPGKPQAVSWSRVTSGNPDDERRMGNPDYERRMKNLRSRLKPMPPVPSPSIPTRSQIVAVDTVEDVAHGRRLRYLVRAQYGYLTGWTFDVEAYRDSLVNIRSVHPIPGRKERLALIAFIGVPWEGGYEAQIPVLLGRGDKTPIPVRWEEAFR